MQVLLLAAVRRAFAFDTWRVRRYQQDAQRARATLYQYQAALSQALSRVSLLEEELTLARGRIRRLEEELERLRREAPATDT